jgi:hypothetical protein
VLALVRLYKELQRLVIEVGKISSTAMLATRRMLRLCGPFMSELGISFPQSLWKSAAVSSLLGSGPIDVIVAI